MMSRYGYFIVPKLDFPAGLTELQQRQVHRAFEKAIGKLIDQVAEAMLDVAAAGLKARS